MGKLILFSVVPATLVCSLVAAREENPLRGFKRALFYALVFDVVYLFAALVVYPRI